MSLLDVGTPSDVIKKMFSILVTCTIHTIKYIRVTFNLGFNFLKRLP